MHIFILSLFILICSLKLCEDIQYKLLLLLFLFFLFILLLKFQFLFLFLIFSFESCFLFILFLLIFYFFGVQFPLLFLLSCIQIYYTQELLFSLEANSFVCIINNSFYILHSQCHINITQQQIHTWI
jgi:hypothetical protein